MPGPRMGPRPNDFDEFVIRQSPTFIKWEQLEIGERLRYACREFVKGQEDDEERLMRRIMIARRNNIRDHTVLKQARAKRNPSKKRHRITAHPLSDEQVASEMDGPAVEATRSYRVWMELKDGEEFVYNQKYVKGREGHDWLLRKNIWRRMRYRRENKRMLENMKQEEDPTVHLDPAAIEAAVAAAESFGKSNVSAALVHNPLGVTTAQEALHAAAQLAAAGARGLAEDEEDADGKISTEEEDTSTFFEI
ncbi:hypothetical protein FisN_16Hu246 [Fistulifera solaris]|uniref:Uncharacterized protein n=1 Tax=Fistulifera solaris TaxID=1519565 RepID=A0A1Z5KSM0_FISSO|nr:hypothetical protein FisN_16Hu246 [Fistulifera solaris]|eukprot:GAX29320.1 hypothetical protein FisN_16Hu246 [Fistulifera solaris]